MNRAIVRIFLIYFAVTGFIFSQADKVRPELLIRCDDIGMSHAVNLALEEMIQTNLPFSASVMFTCPWYQEAVKILKDNPQVVIGIHLTLNAEWKNYRWGPVLGKEAVPSLVDSCGYFFPSRATFHANNPTAEDIEKELRAQIERAISTGLDIKYVDYHMSTAVDKPEHRKIVEQLAREHNLGISRYFGEVDLESMYKYPVEEKQSHLLELISNLNSDQINLLVCHIGKDSPEMQALIDLNTFGLKQMSQHRQAELEALTDSSFTKLLMQKRVKLITYDTIIDRIGLSEMTSPVTVGYK